MMRFWCIIFLIVFAASVSGQDDADKIERQKLSGTWVFNSRKSTVRELSDKVVWTISMAGNEIAVKKSYLTKSEETNHTLRLQSDNSGETNVFQGVRETQTTISKTRWDKRSLVRKYNTRANELLIETIEKYDLSKDGNTLTVEMTIRTNSPGSIGPNSRVPVKRVFDREL
jgi:hypothetical protein